MSNTSKLVNDTQFVRRQNLPLQFIGTQVFNDTQFILHLRIFISTAIVIFGGLQLLVNLSIFVISTASMYAIYFIRCNLSSFNLAQFIYRIYLSMFPSAATTDSSHRSCSEPSSSPPPSSPLRSSVIIGAIRWRSRRHSALLLST